MPAQPAPASFPIESLYVEHHGWLLGWLRRRLGCSCEAADLAHDTFERLLTRPRAPGGSSGAARAYLSTIAKGLCVDLWRRRKVEQAWLDALAHQPASVAPSAEEQAAAIEALYRIDAMLRVLPDKAASAFVLALACGKTDKEVAAELGVSDRMVRRYVAQGMAHCIAFDAVMGAGTETASVRTAPS